MLHNKITKTGDDYSDDFFLWKNIFVLMAHDDNKNNHSFYLNNINLYFNHSYSKCNNLSTVYTCLWLKKQNVKYLSLHYKISHLNNKKNSIYCVKKVLVFVLSKWKLFFFLTEWLLFLIHWLCLVTWRKSIHLSLDVLELFIVSTW